MIIIINNNNLNFNPNNNSILERKNSFNLDNNKILIIPKEIIIFNKNFSNLHKMKKKITQEKVFLHKFMVQMTQKDKEYRNRNMLKN